MPFGTDLREPRVLCRVLSGAGDLPWFPPALDKRGIRGALVGHGVTTSWSSVE